MAILLPFLWHFFVQIAMRMPCAFILEIFSLRKIGTTQVMLSPHNHWYWHYQCKKSRSTMGMLGLHKRRRQNTHQHGCNNRSGQQGGDNPTLKEDDSSLLDTSLALQKSSPDSSTNQQQEQERTKIPVEAASPPTFSPPQTRSPNKKATDTNPPRKSVSSSAQW
jgi:hypothetical protein